MKRAVVVSVVGVCTLIAAIAMFVARESVRPMALPTPGNRAPTEVRTVQPQAGDTQESPLESTAASRRPQSLPGADFNPSVLRALPDDLGRRQLRDIYAELAQAAEAGDSHASLTLGNMVDECEKILYVLKNNADGLKSPDPAIQKLLAERDRVGREQCTQLDRNQLASAGSWLLKAAEDRNRDALLRLRFFAPKAGDQEFAAKQAHWREVLVNGLDTLAQNSDVEAMLNLGEYYLSTQDPSARENAFLYFDMVVGAPTATPQQVDYARRYRDRLRGQISAGNGRSG